MCEITLLADRTPHAGSASAWLLLFFSSFFSIRAQIMFSRPSSSLSLQLLHHRVPGPEARSKSLGTHLTLLDQCRVGVLGRLFLLLCCMSLTGTCWPYGYPKHRSTFFACFPWSHQWNLYPSLSLSVRILGLVTSVKQGGSPEALLTMTGYIWWQVIHFLWHTHPLTSQFLRGSALLLESQPGYYWELTPWITSGSTGFTIIRSPIPRTIWEYMLGTTTETHSGSLGLWIVALHLRTQTCLEMFCATTKEDMGGKITVMNVCNLLLSKWAMHNLLYWAYSKSF